MISTATPPLIKKIFLLIFCLFLLGLPEGAKAQLLSKEQKQIEETMPQWPKDPLGRRSPRGTVSGFIEAVADEDYSRAKAYLNLSETTDTTKTGEDIARSLETLLNQGGQIFPYSMISNENSGRPDDGLAPNQDRVGSVSPDGEEIDLVVEEISGPDGGPIWLFSPETVQKISAAGTGELSPLISEKILPGFLKNYKWGGVPAGHWLLMVILAVLAYLLAWGIIAFLRFLIPLVWKKAGEEPKAGIIKAFALPIKLYAAVWFFVVMSQQIGLSIVVRQKFSWLTVIIGLLAVLILLWRLSEFLGNFSQHRMSARGHISGVSVVLFLKRAAKISIVVFGIIAILGAFGVDVTTGLAALGIGGLALALGAQKTIENFVGSVTLITDQPLRIGDFCRIGDTIGTVEKIGMRSTRIRTLDRTLLTIPNGELSSSKIENYAHRDRFWFHPVFGLRYETTPEQIRYLLVELRKVLYSHPLVSPDPARVRFGGLGADSINIEIFSYIMVSTYDEFLEVKEDLLLRMMDVVEESGTGFAFPSQTIYLSRDSGLSKDKSEKAEAKVKEWREKGEIQLPQFDPEEIEKMRNSIPFPPEGSARRKEN